MKALSLGLLLSCSALASPVELVERATALDSDICNVVGMRGSVCNASGDLSAPKVLRTIQVDSFDDCVAAVHTAPRAQSGSFSVGGEGGACTLYSATISAQGYRAVTTPGTTVFDKACLQCRACQLGLSNGNFQSPSSGGLTPWTFYGDAPFVPRVPGMNPRSTAAYTNLTLTRSGTGNAEVTKQAFLSQTFEVCKGTNYNVSALVRAAQLRNTSGRPRARVLLQTEGELSQPNAAGGLYFPTGGLAANNGKYQPLSFNYTPGIRTARITFTVETTGTEADDAVLAFFIDDVAFTSAAQ